MGYTVQVRDFFNIVSFFGETDGAEIFECMDVLHGNSRFDDIRGEIWDFSKVVDLDLSIEQCRRIAALANAAAKTNSRIKSAVIASDDNVGVMANLYEAEMMSSLWETKVFSNIDEALDWLS